MSANPWTLDLESEAAYLIPWLDTNPDPQTAGTVLTFIGDLLLNGPHRPHLEQGGVYSCVIPGTSVTIIWLTDDATRTVVLAGLD